MEYARDVPDDSVRTEPIRNTLYPTSSETNVIITMLVHLVYLGNVIVSVQWTACKVSVRLEINVPLTSQRRTYEISNTLNQKKQAISVREPLQRDQLDEDDAGETVVRRDE